MKIARRAFLAGLASLALTRLGRRAEAADATLRIALAFEPSSADPHFHNTTPNKALARNIFDALVEQDESQRLRPGLAESWRLIDPLTWEFALRRGVTFHDGSPFTADDVIFTFERAQNVPRSPSSFAGFIRGKTVTKIDDLTCRIATAAPYPQMASDLSTFAIVSSRAGRGATSEDYNRGKAAVGTGPYRLDTFVPSESVTLKRFDGYRGSKPAWERVELRIIKSDPARVAALLAGDVDVIELVPTADIARLRADKRFALASSLSNRVFYLAMDQFRDETPYVRARNGEAIRNPLRDVRVRRAFSLAINRQALVERVMEGEGVPAGQLLPESFFGTSKNLKADTFDLNMARRLLAEAGHASGFRLTLHGPQGRYVNDTKIIEAVAQMLTRLGIEVSVETLPPAAFFARGSTGGAGGQPEFSMLLAGWGSAAGETSDPLRNLVASFDGERGLGASNRGRFTSKTVDELLARALATVGETERAALLAKTVEEAMAQQAVIPLIYPLNTWATKSALSFRPRADEFTLAASVSPA